LETQVAALLQALLDAPIYRPSSNPRTFRMIRSSTLSANGPGRP
jgi:hypothetical protein